MASDAWNDRKGRGRWIRDSTRFAIYARDGWDCVYCRGVFPLRHDGFLLTLDHIIPRSRGGTNAAHNIVTACYSCNSSFQDTPKSAALFRKALAAAARPIDYAAGRFYHERRKDPKYERYESQSNFCF